MTRGNQRIVDRDRAAKKKKAKGNTNNQSGTEYQRIKESDAEKMRAKQQKADVQREAEKLAAAKAKNTVVKTKYI